MVPGHGPLHGLEQTGPALAVPPRLGVLVQGYPGPIGQEADGVDEIEVLHLPHEGDGVPRGLAAEAVVEALLGVDAEGRALLGMERAQSGPAPAHPLECGMLADERHDVGGRPHLGHVLVGYAHGPTVPRRCDARSRRRGQPALVALFDFLASGAGGADARTAWAAANRATGTRKGEQLT